MMSMEEQARLLDEADPSHRHLFHVPPSQGGAYSEAAYMAGNSLGLQPRATRTELLEELDDWSTLAVEGHTQSRRPWVSYHELLREPAARLVGAKPREVVMMNSLTVNLHLLMASFYRPTPERHRILIEDSAFPSDSYAVRSQVALHGYDPNTGVVRLTPRSGESVLRTSDVVAYIHENGPTLGLILLGAVNYYTGEVMDMRAITDAARVAGVPIGWDLAHAAGNIPMNLHELGADFAAWCTYKYINSGPGAVAGAFVHERHVNRTDLPRLEGWWTTDPATRFDMRPVAEPQLSADAWSMSNPPIMALSPVRTSLEIFDGIGIAALRARSLRLTDYSLGLLDELGLGEWVVTPREERSRGSQISVRLPATISPRDMAHRLLMNHGVVADAREPDVIRFAPIALYSTYHDCWRAFTALHTEASHG